MKDAKKEREHAHGLTPPLTETAALAALQRQTRYCCAGLNKTPSIIHRHQQEHTLLGGRGATFAQALLFQILLPGPALLLALVWGNGRKGKQRILTTPFFTTAT